MFPAFRSNSSAIGFCILLIVFLSLPLVANWIGHPSREQAYAGIPGAAGPVGVHVREMFDSSSDADVLILGSSLARKGIDKSMLEQALSAHLGRPAHVEVLALNWQGLDLQYFLLRDYLANHKAGLIVWNLPVPGSRNLEPHIEAFHWVRFGEYSDSLAGLALRYRLALYADMVLGTPRELLSHIRPNLLSEEELKVQLRPEALGYYGAPFVPESSDSEAVPPFELSYEDPPYSLIRAAGKPLNPYEDHFAERIVALARETHTTIAFLHIPIDSEQGMDYMPERGDWAETLHMNAPMIGAPSAAIFKDIGSSRFHNFYLDQHFNINGSQLFTRSVIPAILKAYDARSSYE